MKRVAIITCLISFVAAAAHATGGDAWVMRARRVETPPVIDGVWEEVWLEGEPAGGFRQFRPAGVGRVLGSGDVRRRRRLVLRDGDTTRSWGA